MDIGSCSYSAIIPCNRCKHYNKSPHSKFCSSCLSGENFEVIEDEEEYEKEEEQQRKVEVEVLNTRCLCGSVAELKIKNGDKYIILCKECAKMVNSMLTEVLLNDSGR